jgi:hypothetical protein
MMMNAPVLQYAALLQTQLGVRVSVVLFYPPRPPGAPPLDAPSSLLAVAPFAPGGEQRQM